MKRMNKKADVNVTIMVFMAVIIFVSMLFIFIISQRSVIKSLVSPQSVEAAYSEEAKATFYLNDAAEKALVGLDKNDILFKEKFAENFKKELNSNQDISYLKDLKDMEDKGSITITYNKDNIEILAKDYKIKAEEVSKKYTMIKILYFIPTFSYTETITQLLGMYSNVDIKTTIVI